MATFPLATLSVSISISGITAPPFSDILSSLQASFAQIYGQDVYLGNDTQDGQLLAIFAQAISDSNNAAIAVYNAFSPQTAQGANLSSVVKINGITRLASSSSTVTLLLGGAAGTTINNGSVTDTQGNTWVLPAVVVIPATGQITVTASAQQPGAVSAPVGTVTQIATPVIGWSTVTNTAAAALGAPVETDAQLRLRQTLSVSLPALTVLNSTTAAIEDLPGVTETVVYENDTNTTDSNGLPPHSISAVVEGGNSGSIALAIALKKTPGASTYGTTTQIVTDNAGVPHTINYFVPAQIPVAVNVTLRALSGYSTTIFAQIQAAVAAYINALGIGQSVYIARIYLPAQLNGGVGSNTFELQGITLNGTGTDVTIAFNAQATCTPAMVTVTVH